MEKQTAPSPADLVSYTREVLDSLRLPPIDLPKGNKPGKMRGVEFYGQRLPEVMMECLIRYHRMKNGLPAPPLECKSLREKLFWSKFVVPMPIPTPADKLTVGNFIPKGMRNKVHPARVYWISDRPNFPSSIKGPDGHYFLKANHSWGTAQSISFPIEESKRRELEKLASSWLENKNYNLMGGEWWYSTIKPKLFLESKVIGQNGPAPEYKFLCIKGKVVAIYHPIFEDMRLVAISFYYPDFRWRSGVSTRTMPNPKRAMVKSGVFAFDQAAT